MEGQTCDRCGGYGDVMEYVKEDELSFSPCHECGGFGWLTESKKKDFCMLELLDLEEQRQPLNFL